MGKDTEKLKRAIIKCFPKLANDISFEITSPQTPNYNCIAWAYNYNDRWMWPAPCATGGLDGVCYWPDDVTKTPDVDSFIEAFRKKGYEICDNADFDERFQKIALYVKPGTKECTHAARQLRNSFWTSKLGRENDIQHGTPYTIEGNNYGEVYCIMSRAF